MEAILVNEVVGNQEFSGVNRGATSRNTITILDIELCVRTIGASLISLIGVLSRLLLVGGDVVAIAVDDVSDYFNLLVTSSIRNRDS
jgi:hypothetical protein